jgi:hypothetical protein
MTRLHETVPVRNENLATGSTVESSSKRQKIVLRGTRVVYGQLSFRSVVQIKIYSGVLGVEYYAL